MKDASNVRKTPILSAAEGHPIRDKIEKEPYYNELGPYQRVFDSLLDISNDFPDSDLSTQRGNEPSTSIKAMRSGAASNTNK
jgi:hypothetical protein